MRRFSIFGILRVFSSRIDPSPTLILSLARIDLSIPSLPSVGFIKVGESYVDARPRRRQALGVRIQAQEHDMGGGPARARGMDGAGADPHVPVRNTEVHVGIDTEHARRPPAARHERHHQRRAGRRRAVAAGGDRARRPRPQRHDTAGGDDTVRESQRVARQAFPAEGTVLRQRVSC